MQLDHEGISVMVEWSGGPLTVEAFAEAVRALTDLWSAVSDHSSRMVPASALTYSWGEDD